MSWHEQAEGKLHQKFTPTEFCGDKTVCGLYRIVFHCPQSACGERHKKQKSNLTCFYLLTSVFLFFFSPFKVQNLVSNQTAKAAFCPVRLVLLSAWRFYGSHKTKQSWVNIFIRVSAKILSVTFHSLYVSIQSFNCHLSCFSMFPSPPGHYCKIETVLNNSPG